MRLIGALGTIALLFGSVPALAFEEGKLVIWTAGNRDNTGLEELVTYYERVTGTEVVIEAVEPLATQFRQAAAAGNGPDIVLYAQDRLGEWSAAGLISPVDPAQEWRDGVAPDAMQAASIGQTTWAYPVAFEAAHLIYNRAIITTPPADFEEFNRLILPGAVAPILWDYNNAYFTMPLLMAGGGYAFQKFGDRFDGRRTGVSNRGALAGADALMNLINTGIMPAGVDYAGTTTAMLNAEVGMIINGPWFWSDLTDAGIDFGVAPIPMLDGATVPSFIGVQGLVINAASPNQALAVHLIEKHLTTDEGLAMWNSDSSLGILADLSAAEAQTDPHIAALREVVAAGTPLPSNPEMALFWAAMAPALTNITSGAQSPRAALDAAAMRIAGATASHTGGN